MAEIFIRFNVNVLNVSIRHAKADVALIVHRRAGQRRVLAGAIDHAVVDGARVAILALGGTRTTRVDESVGQLHVSRGVTG